MGVDFFKTLSPGVGAEKNEATAAFLVYIRMNGGMGQRMNAPN